MAKSAQIIVKNNTAKIMVDGNELYNVTEFQLNFDNKNQIPELLVKIDIIENLQIEI